jgi:hypothetical protein
MPFGAQPTHRLAASEFLAKALNLSDPPRSISSDLVALREEDPDSVFSIEMDSSVGGTAFLAYVYALAEPDADGALGSARYQAGVQTLQLAADRDTPGPRLVAHAVSTEYGFILATTPSTWRALNDESASGGNPADTLAPSDASHDDGRTGGAERLLKSLHDANDHAGSWLAAIRAAADSDSAEDLTFTEEETALALHVLDGANVQHILTALNVLVASAQQQAGRAVVEEEGP